MLRTLNIFLQKFETVRKNAALKESSREKSHVRRAKFNGRTELPGWLGKKRCSPKFGQAVAFIEGGG
jgi:hypothetical protein